MLAPGPHHGFSGTPSSNSKFIYKNPGTGHWMCAWFKHTGQPWQKSSYQGHWFTNDELKRHHSNLHPIDDTELFTILL